MSKAQQHRSQSSIVTDVHSAIHLIHLSYLVAVIISALFKEAIWETPCKYISKEYLYPVYLVTYMCINSK